MALLLDLRSLLESAATVVPGEEIPTEVTSPEAEGGPQGVANETDLLNDALGQIGASRISGIDDGSANANWCKTFYPALRRAMLRSHFWNFAERRVSLQLDAIPPAFQFTHAFTLPSDWLRMKEFNGIDVTVLSSSDPTMWVRFTQLYKIEGRKLFTNGEQALIVYIRDVTNPGQWDPLFYQACAAWLASKLALAIAKDANKSNQRFQEAIALLLPLATAVDGQEGSIQRISVPDLIDGR